MKRVDFNIKCTEPLHNMRNQILIRRATEISMAKGERKREKEERIVACSEYIGIYNSLCELKCV